MDEGTCGKKMLITRKKIKQIIAKGESETVEVKKSLTQLKSAMETLCAFLNTKGGIVIIGVNQHGKMIGQEIVDSTQQKIAQETAKIEPFPSSIHIQYLKLEEQGDRQLVVISVSRGDSTPYAYNSRSFYRNQSSTMRMPQSRYSQLLLERGTQSHNSWGTQLVAGFTIDDLDPEEIRHTIMCFKS